MTDLDRFKASYPTDTFLAEMKDRGENNRALMNLGPRWSPNYVAVVCLSAVEFARLVEFATAALGEEAG